MKPNQYYFLLNETFGRLLLKDEKDYILSRERGGRDDPVLQTRLPVMTLASVLTDLFASQQKKLATRESRKDYGERKYPLFSISRVLQLNPFFFGVRWKARDPNLCCSKHSDQFLCALKNNNLRLCVRKKSCFQLLCMQNNNWKSNVYALTQPKRFGERGEKVILSHCQKVIGKKF